MKNKLIALAAILGLIISFAYYKSTEKARYINPKDVKTISFKALPSPPKVKTIDKKEDIEKIVSYINSIKYEDIKKENINGWQFWIELKGKGNNSISFIGNRVHYNKKWYGIDQRILEELQKLYDSMDYKEEPL